MNFPGIGLVGSVARPAAEAFAGLLGEALAGAVRRATNPAAQRRHRRMRVFDGRVHISVRGLRGRDGHRLAEAVERRLGELPCVRWAAVNGLLEQAVIAIEAEADEESVLKAVLEVVEGVEEAHHAADEPLPVHPASHETAERAAWSAAGQLAALPFAVAGRLLRISPLRPEIASLVTIVDTQPRLRRIVAAMVGERNAGIVLAGLSAAAQASSTGILGLTVDAIRHGLRTAEYNAYSATWAAAEPHLTGAPDRASAPCPDCPPRARPLRRGPVERYADQAAVIAGAAFGGALAVTRKPGSAAGAALAAIPKAPVAGRDGFACVLGGALAHRGIVVHDPHVLRRLERIDTVVLDTEVLVTGAHVITDLAPLGEGRAGPLAATAYRLFNRQAPDRIHEDGGWTLGPLDRIPQRNGAAAEVRERLVREGAGRVLVLAEGDRLRALVRVDPEVHDAAEALLGAARGAGLRVVAAGEDIPTVVPGADETAPGGETLVHTVRRIQADGSGVLVISGNREALWAADVAIGIGGKDGAPAWGADLHCGRPGDAVVVVEACKSARQAVGRGVRIAQAAVALGGAVVLAGRSRRPSAAGLAVVNYASLLALATGVWSAVELLRRPVVPVTARHPWHAMEPETVLAVTGSSHGGLTSRQVQGRRRGNSHGNAGHPSLIRAIAVELANPLTPVLAGGAALSAAVGAVLDAGIVLGVTGLTGLIGGVQRHLTDRAVRQLHQRSAVMARVLRDGEERTVPSKELVVGDVITLSGGDVVPADCRLLDGQSVEADESALTGESLPVAKSVEPVLAPDLADRTSMLYQGTTVAAGHARAVVVATGEATEAGRAALATRGAAPKVGVERRLGQITRTTLPLALGSAVAVMAVGLLRGRPARETIGAGVGLAVASVPEGLPFLVSAAQLSAARRLSAQGVLVRDPRTIEAIGRTDVLCFDKTGTLTRGRIELTEVSADGRSLPLGALGRRQRYVLAAALRATPRPRGGRKLEHFTDRAVTSGAEQAGVGRMEGAPGWRHTGSLPFEPSRGFHATRGRYGERRLLSVKGAPEQVIGRCATRDGRPLDSAARKRILEESERLASEGHRVLAVAERPLPEQGKLTDEAVNDLDFLGFLAFTDQVRTTAARSVRQLDEAGVHIVMITGDHPQTAESIARELDVLDGRRAVTGAELDALDDDALDALLPEIGVVARGTPTHKVRVVQGFQRLGRTVAMTGDGANDAPAIRLADVGIALGRRGAPAARAAADLVVTDDRLETILAALVEGRAMWASVRQALGILVGGNLGEIGFTLLGAVLTGTSPLTARQLLLVNLFTDLAPAIAVALRPPGEAAERLLREGPEVSLGTALTDEITVRAMATALGTTAAWGIARVTGRAARARTIALAALVGTQLGQTLLVGGRSPAVVASSVGSMAALAAVVQTPGVSHFFGCTPLGPVGWGIAAACSTAATAGSLLLPPVARRLRRPAGTEPAETGAPGAVARGAGEDRPGERPAPHRASEAEATTEPSGASSRMAVKGAEPSG